MKGLLYVSKTHKKWHEFHLKLLHLTATEFNKANHISGYLYYDNEHFLQYIEGEEKDLDPLYAKIEQDPRHQILNTVLQPSIEQRRFPDWSMHRLNKSALVQIGMDKVLMDYLVMFDGTVYPVQDKVEAKAWGMLEKLAAYRVSLSA